MINEQNDGRDDAPDRRERSSDIPSSLSTHDTIRPNPDCVASIAECLNRRRDAALRCPPIRGLIGLAGRDPWVRASSSAPCTLSLTLAERIVHARDRAQSNWTVAEVRVRLDLTARVA